MYTQKQIFLVKITHTSTPGFFEHSNSVFSLVCCYLTSMHIVYPFPVSIPVYNFQVHAQTELNDLLFTFLFRVFLILHELLVQTFFYLYSTPWSPAVLLQTAVKLSGQWQMHRADRGPMQAADRLMVAVFTNIFVIFKNLKFIHVFIIKYWLLNNLQFFRNGKC